MPIIETPESESGPARARGRAGAQLELNGVDDNPASRWKSRLVCQVVEEWDKRGRKRSRHNNTNSSRALPSRLLLEWSFVSDTAPGFPLWLSCFILRSSLTREVSAN